MIIAKFYTLGDYSFMTFNGFSLFSRVTNPPNML